MATDRRASENVKENEKIVVVKGVAPKSGTELTRERMSKNLRSLNSNWTRRADESQASS